MKKKTKRLLIILSAAILLNVIMNICGNALKTEYYTITTDKLTEPVRIVFISDLHNCTFGGSDQSRIMERIQSEQPDLILFGGDVIDFQGGTTHALRLMELAKDCAPCAYAAGNHEEMRKDTQSFYSDVDQLGIPILNGAYTDITVKGQKVRICGIVDAIGYPNQLETVCQAPDSNFYSILLAHQPEQLNAISA